MNQAVADLLAMISVETDPEVLHKYVNTCYDPDVMRAAANKIYDLCYKPTLSSKCPECGGLGKAPSKIQREHRLFSRMVRCKACEGTGKQEARK